MLLRIALTLILSFITILFSTHYPQHDISAENLLTNPLFDSELPGWQANNADSVSVKNGVLTLSNTPNANTSSVSVAQSVAVAAEDRLLVLSCEASATNVNVEEETLTARVVMFPLNPQGKPRYDVPHTLLSLTGTTPWENFEQVFRVPDENAAVSVVIQLRSETGALNVSSISLQSATLNASYPLLRYALIAVWIIAALWIVAPLLRTPLQHSGQASIMIISGIIIVGVILPANLKYQMTPWLSPESIEEKIHHAELQTSAPFRLEVRPIELNLYKLVHFALFAAIGYLLIARRPYAVPIGLQVGLISVFALATESAQVLASARDGSLSDILIDLLGTCCGLLFASAIHRVTPGKNNQHEPV